MWEIGYEQIVTELYEKKDLKLCKSAMKGNKSSFILSCHVCSVHLTSIVRDCAAVTEMRSQRETTATCVRQSRRHKQKLNIYFPSLKILHTFNSVVKLMLSK